MVYCLCQFRRGDTKGIHCKKGCRFSRPQPGCHLPHSPWPGIICLVTSQLGTWNTVCTVLHSIEIPIPRQFLESYNWSRNKENPISAACVQFSDWIIRRLKKIAIANGRGALFVPSLLIGPAPSSWQHFTPAQVRGGHQRQSLRCDAWHTFTTGNVSTWYIQAHAEVWERVYSYNRKYLNVVFIYNQKCEHVV